MSTSSGGTPGGSTTQVQYNAGAFAGDADFTWDSSANKLVVGSLATPGIIAGVDGASTAGLTVRAGDSTANAGNTLTLRGGNTSNVGSAGGAVNITGGVLRAAALVMVALSVLHLAALRDQTWRRS